MCGAAGVLAEDDVETPVALVLDAPVPADGVGDGGEAAEEEGALVGFAAVWEAPDAVDARQRPEARPLVFLEGKRIKMWRWGERCERMGG